MRVLGIDLFAEAPFRTYITAGYDVSFDALTAFYTQPGAVLISADSAERFGLNPGDMLTLQVGTPKKHVDHCRSDAPAKQVSSRVLEGLFSPTLRAAQELLALNGKLTRIDLIATDAEAERNRHYAAQGLRLAPAPQNRRIRSRRPTATFQLQPHLPLVARARRGHVFDL